MDKNRIERLRDKLKDDFSAVLVEETANRQYISEFRSSAGILIVTKDEAVFIVDFRYIEIAEKTVVGAKVILQETDSIKQLREWFSSHNISNVIVEDDMSLERYRKLKEGIPDTDFASGGLTDIIHDLRSVKEEKELSAIKRAQAITEKAFTDILGYIKPGLTEREVAIELECAMLKNGSEGFAFSSIVVSGINSSLPHGVPGDKKIEQGDFVTMDFGAKKDGYCSDMTRTVAVGFVTDKMRKVYDTVLEAHLKSREAARAGMTGIELDKIARDIIYNAGYEGRFGHGLGHSLGLEVHEEPRAALTGKTILKENVIMTIEPGIYLPGEFGVRIENMVLLKNDGNENLTHSPLDLIVL